MNELTINQIVDMYQEELDRWDFFSDPQRAYVDETKHIVVCLRNYNWYITKYPIRNAEEAIKAIFEIDWIAEYDDSELSDFISYSNIWVKM